MRQHEPDSFVDYALALRREQADRLVNADGLLSFGVNYLDDCLGGLPRNSLLLLGAKTGAGKTHLATQIAHHNASEGKRVHYFALEAEPNEIQRRMKYQLLAAWWYGKPWDERRGPQLNFIDWCNRRFGDQFDKQEREIDAYLQEGYKNLKTYYRKRTDFTVGWFRKVFEGIQAETDLVIVDHLHYFDFDDDSENRALKTAMKGIRDAALLANKPVILLAHMRKKERGSKCCLPDLDDFMGSSDLTKIATDVVLIGPGQAVGKGDTWPTLVRAAKCRRDMSRSRFVGVCGFDSKQVRYNEKYYVARWFDGMENVKPLEHRDQLPYWAKNGSPMYDIPVQQDRKDIYG